LDLILWRHADAEEGVPDDGRQLTAKGEKQAKRVGQWLKAHLPEDARILVSPAKRAQQTAGYLNQEFQTTKDIGTGHIGYGCSRLAGCKGRGGCGWPSAHLGAHCCCIADGCGD
jgi:phosphohistidine phosphatase